MRAATVDRVEGCLWRLRPQILELKDALAAYVFEAGLPPETVEKVTQPMLGALMVTADMVRIGERGVVTAPPSRTRRRTTG